MSPQPRILVVGDLRADAELILRLLRDEFIDLAVCCEPEHAVSEFQKRAPDVLLLAFAHLAPAQNCYAELYRHGNAAQHPHRSVVLCERDAVREAYRLCRERFFDDYVPFWPAGFDAPRLLMAVHQAWRLLQAARGDNDWQRPPALLAAPAEPTAIVAASAPAPPPAAVAVAPATSHGPAPAPATAPPYVAAAWSLGGRLLLVVDDDEFQHRMLRHMLGETDYRLQFALTAAAAEAAVRAQRPDLILMDIDLPDLSGLELTRRFKADPQLAEVPVVMITGHSERHLVVESLRAGASDYVIKPFERDVVLAKLRPWLAPLGKP